jgi:hypothetical protein
MILFISVEYKFLVVIEVNKKFIALSPFKNKIMRAISSYAAESSEDTTIRSSANLQ